MGELVATSKCVQSLHVERDGLTQCLAVRNATREGELDVVELSDAVVRASARPLQLQTAAQTASWLPPDGKMCWADVSDSSSDASTSEGHSAIEAATSKKFRWPVLS